MNKDGKNRNNRVFNVIALLVIFIAAAIYFSGGTFGGFLAVFALEVFVAAAFVLAVLRIKGRTKRSSKPVAKNPREYSHTDAVAYKPARAVRQRKKNFNWIVESDGSRRQLSTSSSKDETKEKRSAAVESSIENKGRKFVPYRSPFDPIVPPEKEREQVQEDVQADAGDMGGIEAEAAAAQEYSDDGVWVPEGAPAEALADRPEEPANASEELHDMTEEEPCDAQDLSEGVAEEDDVDWEEGEKAEAGADGCKESKTKRTEQVYALPPIELLNKSEGKGFDRTSSSFAESNANKLVETLASFGVGARIVNISEGPAVTRYELQPDFGVKVSKIVSLADDIALNLAATGVRIEAPIPGKAAIGIEVPNKEVTPVLLRDVLQSPEFLNHRSKLAFAVGKDVAGKTVVADIARMPHLLIAGATGSGKSVCINTLITSILYKSLPTEVKLIMIDPKVVELSVYNGIPHLLIPVVTDPKKAAGALNWAVQEMTNRYKLFADNNVRDLKGYNALLKERGEQELLPQVVIIIDELADLMMAAPNEVEDSICRLAQMARAAGMHLVIATQRPSVDVITGVIKANIPSRIAFAVSSHIDSRTILDTAGAEKLLGRGDMLFSPIGAAKPIRIQGAFISDKEVEAVVSHVKSYAAAEYDEEVIERIEKPKESANAEGGEVDELLAQAVKMVVELGYASTSLIQRKFKVGYTRAARMLDQMEERGVVGPPEGSRARKVLVTKQEAEKLLT